VLIHQYGPHIFHTNSQAIADYLSNFTEWRDYEHRVLAQVDGMLVPIPINLDTVNRLYGLDLDSEGMEAFLASRREHVEEIRTSEDVVVSTVGRELYESFSGATPASSGAWTHPSSTSPSRRASRRAPTATTATSPTPSRRCRRRATPGCSSASSNHPNIEVRLGTDYRDVRDSVAYKRLIFTGPVDEFFDHRLGRLPLPLAALPPRDAGRGVGAAGRHGELSADRGLHPITEYKHLTGPGPSEDEPHLRVSVRGGDPYYPIPRPENEALYKRYQALAAACENVWFVGRLATYRYYNMDQVVGQALATFTRIDAALSGAADGRVARSMADAAG
jgi:UDP-galactopyranose mutase